MKIEKPLTQEELVAKIKQELKYREKLNKMNQWNTTVVVFIMAFAVIGTVAMIFLLFNLILC